MEEKAFSTEVFMLGSEDLQLRVFLAVPKPFEKPMPLVEIHHGGGGYESIYEEMAIEMAQNGIVGAAMVHRGYPGSEGEMEYGKGEIVDIKNLTEKLIEKPFVDKTRIGIMGYSRGGHNAILAMEQLDFFAAGALWSTPVDMIDLVRAVPWISQIIGGLPDDIPEEYHVRSSIHFVSRIRCPLLILHGEEDDVVSVNHAVRLAREMDAHDKPYEMKLFPEEGHTWTPSGFENNRHLTVGFFRHHLK
jgi:dipeptidyl aminopeptidase/acylaminoacyl peptidase